MFFGKMTITHLTWGFYYRPYQPETTLTNTNTPPAQGATSIQHGELLHLVTSLPTSGARAVLPFEIDGVVHLAVPQLAQDIPGQTPYMNGGDSDIDLLLYRYQNGSYEEFQRLPVSGGEDADFFRIGARAFLATASLRSGKGPYDLNVDSTVFEWVDGKFEPFQKFPGFGAKQWRHFRIGERDFLALAQGVVVEGVTSKNPSLSTIFEWNGATFTPFQTVTSAWGYNWCHFTLDGHEFLCYADHIEPSVILLWDGERFVPFQKLDGQAGRAFCFFTVDSVSYLAFANLLGNSLLYKWNGAGFVQHQVISGPGGREFAYLAHQGEHYVVQVNFLTGTPQAPTTALNSVIYRLIDGNLQIVESFPTLGATGAAVFSVGTETYVAVAESLDAEVRFRTDSHIYRFGAL